MYYKLFDFFSSIVSFYIRMIIYSPWIILTFSGFVILLYIYDTNIGDLIFKNIFIILDKTYYFWLDFDEWITLNWSDIVKIYFYYLFFLTIIFDFIKFIINYLIGKFVSSFKFNIKINISIFSIFITNFSYFVSIVLIFLWYGDIIDSRLGFIVILFFMMIFNSLLIYLYTKSNK